MNNFQIVTIADVERPEPYYLFQEFLESAQRHGHNPLVLGWGQPFKGLGTKPTILKRALDAGQIQGDFICFCDAYDVLFGENPASTAADIEARLIEEGKRIMFNAEKDRFPDVVDDDLFPETGTPWKYLNSGLSMGWTDAYREELVLMGADDLPEDEIHGPGLNVHYEDQSLWQLRYVNGDQIMLDGECEFFQTLSNCEPKEFDFTGDRIRNIVTEHHPDVWHANGGAKTGPVIGPLREKLGI